MRASVADRLVEMMVAAGICRIYGMAGDSLNPLMEALQRHPQLQWVPVRHEETAALAASAESQLSGGIAACCGSCGPGSIHLLNGLYDAHRSHAAVLVLAAHVPTVLMGSGTIQEIHPTLCFRECTAYRELATCPEQAVGAMAQALRTARAQRDVGMVVLPGDVAAMPAAPSLPGGELAPLPESSLLRPTEEALEKLLRLLAESPRVSFLCGAGCAGAAQDIIALAGRLKAPIAYTLRGKEIMEAENPYAVGMTGLLGWGGALHAVLDCDVLVLWGTDFPYPEFLPRQAHMVQVDTDAAALGRRGKLALAIHADAGATARALLHRVPPTRADDFLQQSLNFHAREVAAISAAFHRVEERAALRPELLTRLLSDHAETDTIFTVDTGTPDIWCARYLQAGGRRRIIGSFRHASMGCALAMAIGAKSTYPSRQVVALCGDGGLAMLGGELLTLLQENLAVKVLVYNNSELDFVALQQRGQGMPQSFGTRLRPTHFAAVAKAMGMAAWRVECAQELIPALRAWLAAPGPALLDAAVDSHALPLPPEMGYMRSLGFCRGIDEQSLHGELDSVKRLLFGNRRFFL